VNWRINTFKHANQEYVMVDITIGLAFIAGLVSFISPCVLPLVPAYVGYMGGQVTTQVSAGSGGVAIAQRNRFATVLHGIFFVLGFTFVFVTFGLLTTAGSLALRGSIVDIQEILARLGGLIIIIFGLHVMGLLPRFIAWVMGKTGQMNSGAGYATALLVQLVIAAVLAWSLVTTVPIVIGVGLYLGWLVIGGAFTRPGDFWQRTLTRLQTALYADTRQQIQPRNEAGYAGSALMGVVFSAGWTPCIGPVYGAVLTLAANGGSLSQAGILLAAYSLGLGVPFLLTALALDRMQGLLRRLQRHMRTIELVSGVFLILIGALVMSGQLATLSQIGSTGDFAFNLEHCTTEVFRGSIGLGEFGACMEEGPSFGADAAEEAALTPPTEGETASGSLLDSLSPLAGSESIDLPDVGLGEGFLAPAFQTTLSTGESIALADTRGQVTVLNFWATWCGPCRVEMPHFQALYDARSADGLEILAVNRGESLDRVTSFQEEFELTFPLLMDQDESITAQDYQVLNMPTTYVLDENGVIVARHFGAVTEEQLTDLVDQAFAVADAG
jgi:cytochrome c-type biogenesis protein